VNKKKRKKALFPEGRMKQAICALLESWKEQGKVQTDLLSAREEGGWEEEVGKEGLRFSIAKKKGLV